MNQQENRDNIDILWKYMLGKDAISAEDFRKLAEAAKQFGLLDDLDERVREQIELHRIARDQYKMDNKLQKAEDQNARMMKAERYAAIIQYMLTGKEIEPDTLRQS